VGLQAIVYEGITNENQSFQAQFIDYCLGQVVPYETSRHLEAGPDGFEQAVMGIMEGLGHE
jgi:hypothetical protein